MKIFKSSVNVGLKTKDDNGGFLMKTTKGSPLCNPTALLLYLLQYEPYKTKNHYTRELMREKGIICSSKTSDNKEEMAKDIGVSLKTINRWLDKLDDARIIQKIENPYYPDTDKHGKYLYMLGKIMNGNVVYYYAN